MIGRREAGAKVGLALERPLSSVDLELELLAVEILKLEIRIGLLLELFPARLFGVHPARVEIDPLLLQGALLLGPLLLARVVDVLELDLLVVALGLEPVLGGSGYALGESVEPSTSAAQRGAHGGGNERVCDRCPVFSHFT